MDIHVVSSPRMPNLLCSAFGTASKKTARKYTGHQRKILPPWAQHRWSARNEGEPTNELITRDRGHLHLIGSGNGSHSGREWLHVSNGLLDGSTVVENIQVYAQKIRSPPSPMRRAPRAPQISIATVNPNPPRTDVILNSRAHGRQRRKHTAPSVDRTSLFFLFHQPLLLRPDITKLLLHKGSAHRPVCIEWKKTHIE